MERKRDKWVFYVTGIAAAMTACTNHGQSGKPNIVIILADDMGWGDVNANGNEIVRTPALNHLASRSLSFNRFYVCPLSAPTRAEMLTGRYFLRTGVSSVTRGYENMRSEEVTLAEILKENSYSTGCFGKWHNGGYFRQHPNRQGFDEYAGFCMGHLGYYFDATFIHNDEEIKSSGYTTDFFTDMALSFIEKKKDEPFLCYVAYNVPHSPFQVPEEYFSKYRSAGVDTLLSSVYGMMENMDDNIARILNKLDDLNLRDNTIVIFFSDNGPNTRRYNGGMKGIKGSVDEGGVRVPFYISWPGKIKPEITDQLAQDIDILPSLLGLTGIEYKFVNPIDGKDLSDVITGKIPSFDRFIFSRQGNQPLQTCNASVRNEKYRLVRTRNDTLLYDMNYDPFQEKDISMSEGEIFRQMADTLIKWENDLVAQYIPVTTIEAGFKDEKSFILPVQDATLSGKIKFSSIHPNQSHSVGWEQNGDSIFWKLEIDTPGNFRVDLQYGCNPDQTGSRFELSSTSGTYSFSIDWPFSSVKLPEKDYVKRSESVERTWSWMNIGNMPLAGGSERIVLKLKELHSGDAGMIKAIRFTRN